MYMLTPFVNTDRKHCNDFLINNNPTQISNINNNEKHSLVELTKDHSVTITEADKICAIVLLSTLDYINSSEKLLLDTTDYKKYNEKHSKSSQRKRKT